MRREYVCRRFPFYTIGRHIRFENGYFATDNPEEIALIEGNDLYLVHIWPVDWRNNHHDKESEGGVSTVQSNEPQPTSGASESHPGRSTEEGRGSGELLQESTKTKDQTDLEALVLASGILDQAKNPKLRRPIK